MADRALVRALVAIIPGGILAIVLAVALAGPSQTGAFVPAERQIVLASGPIASDRAFAASSPGPVGGSEGQSPGTPGRDVSSGAAPAGSGVPGGGGGDSTNPGGGDS